MRKIEVDNLKVRNRARKQLLKTNPKNVATEVLKSSVEDIDALATGVERHIEQREKEQLAAVKVEKALEACKADRRDLRRTVGPLRDKLSKARILLKRYKPKTPEEKEMLEDIRREI
jgi:Mg2+ and Co2+ transporter CorA